MDSDRFHRAEELFHEALALPETRREGYVDEAANGDGQVAMQVRRMLRYAERASATSALLIDAPATCGDIEEQEHRRVIGQSIGPYLIVELLGEGGFGAVYRAQQGGIL